MDLLPSEFVKYASLASVSTKRISEIIGVDLMQFTPANDKDISSRQQALDNEINIENWQILKSPSQKLLLKRIARRKVFQTSQVFCAENCQKASLVGTTAFNSILFEGYANQTDFIDSITEKFEGYQSVEQDLKYIQNLSSDEFFVLTALLELFIEKYPDPTGEWIPDELLVFTSESLLITINESEEKIEDQTWWQNWKEISNSSIPNVEDIETAILLLANKALVGMLDEVDGKEVFFIGQSLLWLIRSLVWWDRGFIIENDINKIQLYVFQASSLFALVVENNQNYSLFNIDGTDLPQLVSNFISDSTEGKTFETDEIQEEMHQKPKFCPNCGTPVIADSKFCANCGHKLT